MKVIRSTKCSLKYLTEAKRTLLVEIRLEYTRVVNVFIERFWQNPELANKAALLKEVLEVPDSWFCARMRKMAAREAVDMVKSALLQAEESGEEAVIPAHCGKRMCLSGHVCLFQKSKNSNSEFDYWLHFYSVGKKIKLELPIRLHKHYHKLSEQGRLMNSVVIFENSVQFSFEIDTGKKRTGNKVLGIDAGMNTMLATSDGRKAGPDFREKLERVLRCEHGSKGQLRAKRAMFQYMDEEIRDLFIDCDFDILVLENLTGITLNRKGKCFKNTNGEWIAPRRRRGKTMRRLLARWNLRHCQERLESRAQINRVGLRHVSPSYTSQICSICGHREQMNRVGSVFSCRSCGHTDDADLNAAVNIAHRFVSGPYGAGRKLLTSSCIRT